jgi:sulfite reductase (ferredoxin)
MGDQLKAVFPSRAVPEDPGVARLTGLYPQRQEGLWMQRVVVPGGVMTARQWTALGRIAREFTPAAPLHLTTRQDVELHDVALANVCKVQQALDEAALSGLGSGGNSIRNITVCPCSGLRKKSVGLLPLAREIRRTLGEIDGILTLPRKFKIALACGESCGQPWINDIGLVARRKGARWGFMVTVGGSLGTRPGTGMELFDWLSADDVLPLATAVVGVFAAHGDRENRSRARLRHVRERMGDAAFAALIQRELDARRRERAWAKAELPPAEDGFASHLTLTFADGDVTPEAADALAALSSDDDLRVRIANQHRVVVFARDAGRLHDRVAASGTLTEAARPQTAVVTCPGTRWCSRALTDTNRLAGRIRTALRDELRPEAVVCISGCPNGCAHSAVADIGVVGKLATRDGRKTEAYDILAGGDMGRTGKLATLEARSLSPEDAMRAVIRLAPASR